MTCIPFCERCSELQGELRCDECIDGFLLVEAVQQVCAPCAHEACAESGSCGTYYYQNSSLGACLPKPEFCVDVADDGSCEKCLDGFVFANYTTGRFCTAKIANCVEYTNSGACAECEAGFYGLNCTACLPNCERCVDEQTCEECFPAYILDENAATGAQSCKIANGKECFEDADCLKVDECFQGKCGRKYGEDCRQATNEFPSAIVCSQRYECVDEGCYHKPGSVANCKAYYSFNEFCSKCEDGYYLNLNTNTCFPCSKDCEQCGTDGFCFKCRSLWHESIKGKCRLTEWVTCIIIAVFYIAALALTIWGVERTFNRKHAQVVVEE